MCVIKNSYTMCRFIHVHVLNGYIRFQTLIVVLCIIGAVHEELTRAFEKTKRTLRAELKSKDTQTNSTLSLSSLNQNSHHRQWQRCNVIGEFASSISSEVVAQSAQIDLDNSMENFKVCTL